MVRCNKCGREYFTTADNVVAGSGCRICAAKERPVTKKTPIKYKNVKEAFESFESLHNSWISKWAAELDFSDDGPTYTN